MKPVSMNDFSNQTWKERRQLPTAVWIVAFGLAAATCGLVYDAVWSIAAMGVCLLGGATLGLLFACTEIGRNVAERARTIFRGACLGIITWIFSLFSWFALEIAAGG